MRFCNKLQKCLSWSRCGSWIGDDNVSLAPLRFLLLLPQLLGREGMQEGVGLHKCLFQLNETEIIPAFTVPVPYL